MELSLGDVCGDNAVDTNINVPDSDLHAQLETKHIPSRSVICGDALEWLTNLADGSLPGSVFTSLPDISELPHLLGGLTVYERARRYKLWFSNALDLIFRKLAEGQYAVFLQSDCRVQEGSDIVEWIDKGHLCASAADRGGAVSMWHKLVLISGANKRSGGRPAYSHLICFRKGAPTAAYQSGAFFIPDVFDRGHMLWPKGIGLNSCLAGISFLRTMKNVTNVTDPFCGVGTVLTMANVLGLDSIGVEISAKRCTKARMLNIADVVMSMSRGDLSMMGCNLKRVTLMSEYALTTSGVHEASDNDDDLDEDDIDDN
jgi:hypothetical protein